MINIIRELYHKSIVWKNGLSKYLLQVIAGYYIRPCHEENTVCVVTSTHEQFCTCDYTAKKIST